MPTRFGKFISGSFFPKLFLAVYVLFVCSAAYETDKAVCLLTDRTHLFGTVYIFYFIFSVLVITKKRVSPIYRNRWYRKTTSFMCCFLLYYFTAFVIWEIVCFLFSVNKKIKSIGLLCAIAMSIMVVLLGYLHTKRIAVKKYSLSFGSGRKHYRIALVSDLHLGIFVNDKHMQRMVEKLNALNPDAVVIAGDIFDVDKSLLDCPKELKTLSNILRRIKSKDGVYAVKGNHDPETNHVVFQNFLKSSKINLLNDDVKILNGINLVGRTDGKAGERTELAEILASIQPQNILVIVDHRPENMDESIMQHADLALCGHTHRGQMFPITLFTKWANGKSRFYGHGIDGTTHSIITSGVGFFELPMRLGTSNEIVNIELEI